MPTRNPIYGVCANNYAMGAPLTPILPTLRHGPPNVLCRSLARNYRFPCQGNEIVDKGGGRGWDGNQGGRQNWCSRQSVVSGFFRFFPLGIFSWNFWERKKMAGNSPAGPLSVRVHPYAHPQHMKVLNHFLYIQYGCGMKSGMVYSLNHDTITSFGLQTWFDPGWGTL
jgi:hypothetical protein